MAESMRIPSGLDRREFLTAAGLAGASSMFFGSAVWAASDLYPEIRKAAEAARDASIKRIQDWIALPSIAAENLNMPEGAEYMANLAREAGFDKAEIVPTDGHPGVFATMDNGAKHTLGLYFMYDVKQFDPAEWSSPPLEARIVDKPGFGRAIVGRGAVTKAPAETFLEREAFALGGDFHDEPPGFLTFLLASAKSNIDSREPAGHGPPTLCTCDRCETIMPTVLRSGPYRYSNERREPPHVHVRRDNCFAKFWLRPTALAGSKRFPSKELRTIQGIIEVHRDDFLEAWDEHIGR